MTFSIYKIIGTSTFAFAMGIAVADWHGSSSNVHSNTRSVSLHDKENWLYAEHEGNRFEDSITRNASGCSATAPVLLFDQDRKPLKAGFAGEVAPWVGIPACGATFAAIVTSYCPCELCCGSFADGVTASGHVIQPGDKFVAADPSIPFGTLLDVPGYGIVPVLDRGGAIEGNKIDVYMPDHDSALRFGRKQLHVRRM